MHRYTRSYGACSESSIRTLTKVVALFGISTSPAFAMASSAYWRRRLGVGGARRGGKARLLLGKAGLRGLAVLVGLLAVSRLLLLIVGILVRIGILAGGWR